MNKFALILYFLGLIGICISIPLLAFKIHKKNTFFKFFSALLILVSFFSLGIGTVLSIININNNTSNETTTENQNSENDTNLINESYDNSKDNPEYSDLSFLYNINQNVINSVKEASIKITNNSCYVFNGNVNIDLLNSDGIVTSTLKLPVKNLAPNNSTEAAVNINNDTNDIHYSFSGDFTEKPIDQNCDYIIKNITIGNNYIRFDIYTSDKSLPNLESICREFKQTYTSQLCSGFLIYFLNDTQSNNFVNSFSEFFCDNVKGTSILSIYKYNKNYNIS